MQLYYFEFENEQDILPTGSSCIFSEVIGLKRYCECLILQQNAESANLAPKLRIFSGSGCKGYFTETAERDDSETSQYSGGRNRVEGNP